MTQKINPHSIEIFETLSSVSGVLDPEASEAIGSYIRGQLCPDGGFADRNGDSDLYYTMFGLSCAVALKLKLPDVRIDSFLECFQTGTLDLPHLNCLIKSRAALSLLRNPVLVSALGRFSALRKLNIDSSTKAAVKHLLDNDSVDNTAYNRFLLLNAAQDCGLKFPGGSETLRQLELSRQPGGGFSNRPDVKAPALNATVAAILLKRQLSGENDAPALKWLSGQAASSGGFKATPETPLPDLMSTATALFTLKICGMLTDENRRLSRGFILDHWQECGGFSGNIVENHCDCEYTFYGLLAMGAIA